jgi:hypothetical protein
MAIKKSWSKTGRISATDIDVSGQLTKRFEAVVNGQR